jgi:hypothetical protein
LAGESPADKVDAPIPRIVAGKEGFDVSDSSGVGPVFFKDSGCIVIYLDLPGCFETTSTLESEFEPANTRKKAANC